MRPNCFAWDTIRAVLADGPANAEMLAREVYGEVNPHNRHAMSLMLTRLSKGDDPYYAGGPWLARVRYGWYALPGDAPPRASLVDLVGLLKARPRTIEDLARRLGIAPGTVVHWLTAARRRGVPVLDEPAPRWRWPEGGWCRWYWIGPTARRKVAA